MESLRAPLQTVLRHTLGSPELQVTAVEPIPEGHSGFTYFVHSSDNGSPLRHVLRVPPPGTRPAGPADVLRQGRIMAALHRAGLPVPAVPAMADAPGLDGRPYVLMQAVEGLRIEPTLLSQTQEDIARSAVAVLRRLHELPLEDTGLGDEEVVSLEQEMIRWAWLMQRAPDELTQRAPELGTRLVASRPPDPTPTLVHGDYHYGNMLFRGAEVVAVLDWEISEIGAPLLDLGCLSVVAQKGRFAGGPNPGGGLDILPADIVRWYGADAGEFQWYLALTCYKYASIFGYNLMLHRRGKRPDPMYEQLTGTITGLIDQGLEMLA